MRCPVRGGVSRAKRAVNSARSRGGRAGPGEVAGEGVSEPLQGRAPGLFLPAVHLRLSLYARGLAQCFLPSMYL